MYKLINNEYISKKIYSKYIEFNAKNKLGANKQCGKHKIKLVKSVKQTNL